MERGPFGYLPVQDPLEHVAHLPFHLLRRPSSICAENLLLSVLVLLCRAIAQASNRLRPRSRVDVVRQRLACRRSRAALVETSKFIDAILVFNSIVYNHEAKKNVPRFLRAAIPENIALHQTVVYFRFYISEGLSWRVAHQI